MASPKHPAHEVDQTALARPAREASISPIPEERRILAMAGQARRVGKWLTAPISARSECSCVNRSDFVTRRAPLSRSQEHREPGSQHARDSAPKGIHAEIA